MTNTKQRLTDAHINKAWMEGMTIEEYKQKLVRDAAPDLLEALERCYDVFKMDDVDTSISMQCGMAITKARGQS